MLFIYSIIKHLIYEVFVSSLNFLCWVGIFAKDNKIKWGGHGTTQGRHGIRKFPCEAGMAPLRVGMASEKLSMAWRHAQMTKLEHWRYAVAMRCSTIMLWSWQCSSMLWLWQAVLCYCRDIQDHAVAKTALCYGHDIQYYAMVMTYSTMLWSWEIVLCCGIAIQSYAMAMTSTMLWPWYIALYCSHDTTMLWPWDIILCYGHGIQHYAMAMTYSTMLWPWHTALCYGHDIQHYAMAMTYSTMLWPRILFMVNKAIDILPPWLWVAAWTVHHCDHRAALNRSFISLCWKPFLHAC